MIGGADAAQQLIRAGLLDQIQISLSLFEGTGPNELRLEKLKVIDSPGRTDIRYRVVSE